MGAPRLRPSPSQGQQDRAKWCVEPGPKGVIGNQGNGDLGMGREKVVRRIRVLRTKHAWDYAYFPIALGAARPIIPPSSPPRLPILDNVVPNEALSRSLIQEIRRSALGVALPIILITTLPHTLHEIARAGKLRGNPRCAPSGVGSPALRANAHLWSCCLFFPRRGKGTPGPMGVAVPRGRTRALAGPGSALRG